MRQWTAALASLCVLLVPIAALAWVAPPDWYTSSWGHDFYDPHPQHSDMHMFIAGSSSESRTANLAQYTSCSPFGAISFGTAYDCAAGGPGGFCREAYFDYNKNSPGTATCVQNIPGVTASSGTFTLVGH